jgi:hypothetical protein
MPPSGKCLHGIALAVAMVYDFVKKKSNKTQLLHSILMVDGQKKSY